MFLMMLLKYLNRFIMSLQNKAFFMMKWKKEHTKTLVY